MPPKKYNPNNESVPTVSVNNTIDLFNDFEAKKRYFEETIVKLKNFSPVPVSPARELRHSPRLNTPSSSNITSSPNHSDVSLLVQQVNYLFETNLQLINIINDLKNKYEILEKKTDSLSSESLNFKGNIEQINKDLQNKISINDDIPGIGRASSENASFKLTLPNTDFKYIENKLARLEQYEANKYIVCQGVKINELIDKATNNNENIKDTFKNHFSSILDRESRPLLDEIVSAKVYGKDKKILKLELSQKIMKGKVISVLKRSRPNGLYISEFLVPIRLKLFHDVRIFAKTIPDKVESVFTRNGFTYYKNKMSGEVNIIENDESFSLMKAKLTA